MKKLLLLLSFVFAIFIRIDSAWAIDYPFSLTTSATNEFSFKLSAQGTFYVDCGTGGTLSGTGVSGETIIKNNTVNYTYKCSYSNSVIRTIRFGGIATDYPTPPSSGISSGDVAIVFNIGFGVVTDANAAKITAISGNLSTIFPYISANASDGPQPRFYYTFLGANITYIPDTLFSGYTRGSTNMFYSTFSDCAGLQTIPSDLFESITTGASGLFSSTFNGCTGLQTIPSDLFESITTGANSMFNMTFSGCTGLQTIPSDLFKNITIGAEQMFRFTFRSCTGLRTIPPDLFANITTGATNMFRQTFNGCSNLTGYIPPTLFDGLIKNNAATNTFNNTFGNTGIDESCSSGTPYATDYTSAWGGKVSCLVPINMTFDGGSPMSCTLGSTFLPPTPPARPGYVFTGWKAHVGECGIWRLDRSIDGTAYAYQTNYGTGGSSVSNYGITTADTWAVEFNYGTIWGKSRCSTTSGSNHSLTWPSNSQSDWLNTPADDNGRYCWCQVTGFTAVGNSYTSGPACTTAMSSLWVYNYGDSREVDCAANCALNCATAAQSYTVFRTPIFNAAGQ